MEPVWVVTRQDKTTRSEQFKAVYTSKELALSALSSRNLQWEDDGYSQCTADDPNDPDWTWYIEEAEVDDSPLL